MHARLSTYSGIAADRAEDGIKAFQGSTGALQKLDGFEGGYLLLDRAGGRAITITLWASEEAEAASAEVAKKIRGDAVSATDMSVESVDTYEVAVQVQPDA